MLSIILQKALQEKGLSSHRASEQIGVSHTTILRALRGEVVDVDTIIKFANFLNVRPSELLDSMGDQASLPEQLAVLLSRSPELEEELRDAVERIQAGALDVNVLRDIVSYAQYKLSKSGEQDAQPSTKPSRPRSRVS